MEIDTRLPDSYRHPEKAFTDSPILQPFDWTRSVILETDASDYVSAGIISQYGEDGILHPVAFFSKKHSPAECNYEIYDKELLAIIRCFEEWRLELERSPSPIQIISNHRNLEYFTSTKLLNRRQARWSEFLSRFNFKIVYRPEKYGTKPNSLTRRSENLPKEGDERLLHQSQTVLKRENFDLSDPPEPTSPPESINPPEPNRPRSKSSEKLPALMAPVTRSCKRISFEDEQDLQLPPEIQTNLRDAYERDNLIREIQKALATGKDRHPKITLAACERRSSFLFYENRLWIPDNEQLKADLTRLAHDKPASGHSGRSRTYKLLFREYYWSNMYRYVVQWVQNCRICRRTIPSREVRQGILKSLPVPERARQDVSMDFIIHLPMSQGYDAILVVVNRLIKMKHLILCNATVNAQNVAMMYTQYIWKLHGLSISQYISDGDGRAFGGPKRNREYLLSSILRALRPPRVTGEVGFDLIGDSG